MRLQSLQHPEVQEPALASGAVRTAEQGIIKNRQPLQSLLCIQPRTMLEAAICPVPRTEQGIIQHRQSLCRELTACQAAVMLETAVHSTMLQETEATAAASTDNALKLKNVNVLVVQKTIRSYKEVAVDEPR